MSLNYDQLLAGNCFGQINVTTPISNNSLPSSMTNTSDIKTDEKKSSSLTEQFDFSIEHLFNMARYFLKGI
jgi:hypothetical protein